MGMAAALNLISLIRCIMYRNTLYEVSIEMIAWIALLVLLAVEVAGLVWWLRKEYLPFIFHGKAPLIYSAVLAADFAVAWLVSMLDTPGGTPGTALLAVIGLIQFVIVVVLTLFVQWIVRSDLTDIK